MFPFRTAGCYHPTRGEANFATPSLIPSQFTVGSVSLQYSIGSFNSEFSIHNPHGVRAGRPVPECALDLGYPPCQGWKAPSDRERCTEYHLFHPGGWRACRWGPAQSAQPRITTPVATPPMGMAAISGARKTNPTSLGPKSAAHLSYALRPPLVTSSNNNSLVGEDEKNDAKSSLRQGVM